ncbi:MAG: hypothetical protein EP298_00515 [Gammaproteobacteria bacterium]|nr:MAG: hypothetical protein EP298_00515 [Gammaproteobacteria bacterium]UTW41898.1 hypothetical protein KFE69_10340 [bacterium SCSIO 12844]
MFDKEFAKEAIRKVIRDEETLKNAVIYAIENAYKDHDQAKGVTNTASQSSSFVGGWAVSAFRFVSKYEPLQDWMTSETHKGRLSSASDIKDDVKSGNISPMLGLWKIGQEGHWSEGGVIYTPSFNTKAMRYFILYCIEHCHNIKMRNDIWQDDPKGIDRESKDIYQSIINEYVLFPNYQIVDKVALNSKECANLLVALSGSDYSELFKDAVLAAANRAYSDFKGLGIRKTYNYEDRIRNTSNIITCLRNNEISAATAFRLLADEGEWNSQPSSMYNSFNTMFVVYLVEHLADKLPELNILKDYSLYREINSLPDNKRDLFGISKKIFTDYMQIGFDTYKKAELSKIDEVVVSNESQYHQLQKSDQSVQQYASHQPQMHTTQQPPSSMIDLYTKVLGGTKTPSYHQPQYPRSSFFTTGNQFDSHQSTSSYTGD